MNILGIEFASLHIPLERRLQTLGVLYHTFLFVFQGVAFSILLLYIALCTRFYYVSVAIFLWVWLDRKTCERGGRRFQWIRNWVVWRWMKDYFPARLIKTADLDPDKNYIGGYHPHGITVVGGALGLGSEGLDFSKLYPGITPYVLTLNVQFMLPIHRDIMMGLGCCSVTKESIDWILSKQGKGQLACIIVGGAKEALNAHSGLARLTLKNRKGFVRRAIKNGASLVPIFSFGENEIYKQLSNPEGSMVRKFQNFMTNLTGVSPPFVSGRGIFQYTVGLLPHRKPIDIIVGKPIDVEKLDDATEDDVDRVHKKYLEELKALYDEHKGNYELYKNVDMEFV